MASTALTVSTPVRRAIIIGAALLVVVVAVAVFRGSKTVEVPGV